MPLARTYARLGDEWPPRTGDGRETVDTLVSASASLTDLVVRPPATRVGYTKWLSESRPGEFGVFPGLVVVALAGLAVVRLRPTTARPSRPVVWLRWGLGLASALVVAITAAAVAGTPGQAVVGALRPLSPFVLLGIALAATGLAAARRSGGDDQAQGTMHVYGAMAVAGVLFALGPQVIAGGTDVGSGLWRLDLLPVRLILRAPERLVLLVTTGLAVLAGLGVAHLLRHRPAAVRVAATAAILATLNADLAFRAGPLLAVPAPGATDEWLASTAEDAIVMDYPLWVPNGWTLPASRHLGRRFANGGGYLRPPPYTPMEELPDLSAEQLAVLWEHFHPGIVVVHTDRYGPEYLPGVLDAIATQPEALRPLASFGSDRIYELVDRGRGPELFRRWPRTALSDAGTLVMDARITSGRSGTEGTLTVSLNGQVLLEKPGATTQQQQSYRVSFDRDDLVQGINTFEIAAAYVYPDTQQGRPVGTTGATLAADVAIASDRLRATALINGRLIRPERGYMLAVLDAATGRVTRVGMFDVSWYESESEALVAFVDAIPAGSPVVVATEFDVSRRLTAAAVNALESLGLASDLRDRFQTMHAAIGVKGAPRGSALEVVDRIAARLDLGAPHRREVRLASLSIE